ncbi:hypothetical protein [Helicobacter cappadocius]|uniref:Uncharacterized protein n=1 Tax=Helicobacter cappadocius TaxID=3063998 RepID=A0AA90Q191_9HELI|nr:MULTISPECIES: hypothetical protein [unclassified Helicobacter]MDO7252421.1 hypothetical protein [Helicobacter sp. faydin-H75]MDP2538288.1 hypothetical protein [Helicobacter sp. faydin-H76]
MKKKLNLWPFGILAVIVIGVVLLVRLVVLSSGHPDLEEIAYGGKKYQQVEKDINPIIKNTKAFQAQYSIYIDVNQKPLARLENQPLMNYEIKGNGSRLADEKKNQKAQLFTDKPNKIYVDFVPKAVSKSSKNSTSGDFSSSPISNIRTIVFLQRYYAKEKMDIGELECDKMSCVSRDFNLTLSKDSKQILEGRWRVSLEISYNQDGVDKTITLEKEFFAAKHP